METTYNGWANWETWNTSLWFDGYFDAEELADEDDPAGYVEQVVTDLLLEGVQGLASDFISTSLGRVDWQEIADSVLAGV
jgi:hypothetical protein